MTSPPVPGVVATASIRPPRIETSPEIVPEGVTMRSLRSRSARSPTAPARERRTRQLTGCE